MRRGRPRTFDADEALDRAMRVFWRRGYRATTTRDLERAIGIGQSSITHAFGPKERLLGQALERYVGRLEHELLGPLRDSDEGLVAVDAFLGKLSEWLTADGARGCLIGRMLAETDPPEAVVPSHLRAYRTDLRAALGAALGRAAASGEIGSEQVASRVDLLVGTVLGCNLALQAGFGAEEVRALIGGARAEVGRWDAGGG